MSRYNENRWLIKVKVNIIFICLVLILDLNNYKVRNVKEANKS